MRRRSSNRVSGAICIGIIAALGLLGPACGFITGSETISGEPAGDGGKGGSVGNGGGGMGGAGGAGGAGGEGGSGGVPCAPVEGACEACLTCGPIEAVAFTKPETKYFQVATTGGAGSVAPDAIFGCSKAAGPERVYAVTYSAGVGVNPKGFLTARLKRAKTTFDSVLYAKKDCCIGPTEACSDSTDGAAGSLFGGEVLSVPIQSGETWYVFVDGADADDMGDYELEMNISYGWGCVDEAIVPVFVEPGSPMTLKGTTDIDNITNGCGGPGPGWEGWGSSVVYALSWASSVTAIDITLKSTDKMATNDTIFYIREQCVTQDGFESTPPSELACIDIDSDTGETYPLSLAGLDPPIFVFADVGKDEGGPFELTLTPKQ